MSLYIKYYLNLIHLDLFNIVFINHLLLIMMLKTQKDLLRLLIDQSVKLVDNYDQGKSLENHCVKYKLNEILPKINVSELNLDKNIYQIKDSIGIWTIFDRYPLRITFYYLPLGFTMKLHDHPEM